MREMNRPNRLAANYSFVTVAFGHPSGLSVRWFVLIFHESF